MSNGLKGLEKLKQQNDMNCDGFVFDFNYFDAGNIKVDLFSDIAENIVKRCFKFYVDSDYERKWDNETEKWKYKEEHGKKWEVDLPKNKRKLVKKLSSNQIRKFYNDILNYKEIIENSENKEKEFQKQLPYIKMIKAKAHVSFERGHINTNFKKFIDKGIDSIKDDIKNFNIFVTFFESIVAYSKGNLED